MSWHSRRNHKNQQRAVDKFTRSMNQSVKRGEMYSCFEATQREIASVALAIEALEAILIEKGVLGADELMKRVEALAKAKGEEQKRAAEAVAALNQAQPSAPAAENPEPEAVASPS